MITKILYTVDAGYEFIGVMSADMPSVELAEQSVADDPVSNSRITAMLSVEGSSRAVSVEPIYRKYVVEAYLHDSLVDRITFVCRYM